MPSLKSLLALLPLALSATAAPSPALDIAYANDTDVDAASRRAVAIDGDGRSRIIICNDARRGGQCLNWGQKGHCCKIHSLSPASATPQLTYHVKGTSATPTSPPSTTPSRPSIPRRRVSSGCSTSRLLVSGTWGAKVTDDDVNRDYDCKGATLQVTSPGIDNLADRGFNDRVSSFSWFLR